MAQLEYDTQSITDAVIARLAECQDPRFKQVMTSLIGHLHAFARDVDLKGDEWFKAIEFLTACGKAGAGIPCEHGSSTRAVGRALGAGARRSPPRPSRG